MIESTPTSIEMSAARRRSIFVIKLLHSFIYLFMSACIAYLYVAALTRTFDWKLWLASGAITLELITLLLSGRRCPLTLLALRLGDATGNDLIADRLLPSWAVRRTVPVCGLIMLGGVTLLVVTLLRKGLP